MSAGVAMMFPGQGSQALGMLSDMADPFPVVGETFAEASDALGEDLWALAQQGPEEALNSTENTQPVLLAASVAIYRSWLAAGGQPPLAAAGHSLGEYSALVCADALSLADGIRLVRLRGKAMQSAVPVGTGAMAAILGLDDAGVEQCCEQASLAGDGTVSAANYNAPGQVVIAGSAAAVERAIEACKAAGARRAMPLAVSVPSHCALMQEAVAPLRQGLDDIAMVLPSVPVFHNVDAEVSATVEDMRTRLLEQLHAPVRWTSCVAALKAAGASTLIECGPGKVLSGMLKRIDPDLTAKSVGSADALSAALVA